MSNSELGLYFYGKEMYLDPKKYGIYLTEKATSREGISHSKNNMFSSNKFANKIKYLFKERESADRMI